MRRQYDMFKVLTVKEKNLTTKNNIAAKLSSEMKRRRKRLLNKQALREFIIIRLTFQDMLKGILQIEIKRTKIAQ
jgi:hypothetical protein